MVGKKKKMHMDMMGRFSGRKRVPQLSILFLADVEKVEIVPNCFQDLSHHVAQS